MLTYFQIHEVEAFTIFYGVVNLFGSVYLTYQVFEKVIKEVG